MAFESDTRVTIFLFFFLVVFFTRVSIKLCIRNGHINISSSFRNIDLTFNRELFIIQSKAQLQSVRFKFTERLICLTRGYSPLSKPNIELHFYIGNHFSLS